MVNLEFCDTRNMVAYLEKPEGSEEFYQIVDFLNASNIRHALTENHNIYVSLINQFWGTATARTLDNGEVEITATIDGKVKIVTEASVRRHLKLADFDGISSFPSTDTFEQLSLMGNMKKASKGYTEVDIPLFSTMLVQGPIVQGEGSTVLVESHHTPIRAPSTSQPHFSPTLRIPIRQKTEKVESLEKDLKQTKKIYGAAYTKLIKKGKKLEKTIQSSQAKRRARIVVFDDEDDLEDSSKQGRKIVAIDKHPAESSFFTLFFRLYKQYIYI
nr:hypothetical protein [Tanacetum cinerariifolium]